MIDLGITRFGHPMQGNEVRVPCCAQWPVKGRLIYRSQTVVVVDVVRTRHWATAVGTLHRMALGSFPQPGTQTLARQVQSRGQFILGECPPAISGRNSLKEEMNLRAAWISVCFIHQ